MDNNITVRIDSDLKNWLKEYAYQNRKSISDIVRDYLELLKNQEEKE